MFMLEEEGKYDVTRAKRETKLESGSRVGWRKVAAITIIVEELRLEDTAGSVK